MLGRVCLRTTLAVLCLIVPVVASAQTKLLRFPDIYGDRVVFTYGGDLWTAGSGGGTATRLTAHPGMEVFGQYNYRSSDRVNIPLSIVPATFDVQNKASVLSLGLRIPLGAK